MKLEQLQELNEILEVVKEKVKVWNLNNDFEVETFENSIRLKFKDETVAFDANTVLNDNGWDAELSDAHSFMVVDLYFK